MGSSRSGFTLNAGGFPQPQGLYDPQYEHDNCGMGFICKLDQEPTHELVRDAVRILINLEHRGAVGGDEATGDGAGLLLQMPDRFFRKVCSAANVTLPASGDYAVGMVFLPTDKKLRERCKAVVDEALAGEGLRTLCWREVPTDDGHLGTLAKSTEPVFSQVFVSRESVPQEKFELKLYVARRVAEKSVAALKEGDASQFYVATLSSRTVAYKGMLTATQIERFFPDLADPDFTAAFALVHQRYSTNTLPTWSLAHPFRCIAHNGEINTLRGNINRMRAREPMLRSEVFGDDIEKLKPILNETGSDSAIFDQALELLVAAGRPIPHAMMMMIPEAFGTRFLMSEDKRSFYEYNASIMEPWDGPAAVTFTDGRHYIGATLDRNGLRPARYTITKSGLVVLASETGVIEIPPEDVLQKGRLQPGKMFLVDLQQKRVVSDSEIKGKIVRGKPYRHWLKDNRIELRGLHAPSFLPAENPEILRKKQHAFGYTDEEVKMIISPMASHGQEPIGSMGNDAALAVLSNRPQSVFAYFKQLFAQVTNPPIDPLREELVMSLMSFIGKEQNLLTETPAHVRRLKLQHPILTPGDMVRLRMEGQIDMKRAELPMLFPADGDGKALEAALDTLFARAEEAIRDGAELLILTDSGADAKRAPIPSLLASSGLHHHLIRKGLRNDAAIIVETGEAREVIHFALLIGYGANAVCPTVAFSTIRELAEGNLLEKPLNPEDAMDAYITAVKKGLLKTFSRMGISTVRSFFGAQIFEAVGLNRAVIDKYFARTASRVEGIGLDEIAVEAVRRHRAGYPANGSEPPARLDAGGQYHYRKGGENHLWTPQTITKFQQAVRSGDYKLFKEYSRLIDDQSEARVTLRSLFKFKQGTPVPLAEVEPEETIVKRFVSSAMSFGSISKEAHETIAVAVNRIGAKSNCGEGGEDPVRYTPLPNGDSLCSKVKQVASGRFGVTAHYLVNAEELQIKIAQGAKPGEGGQLPGHKVDSEIARVRHTTPGVTLVSPPPHHDIYSIEDLAQLIYDLKAVSSGAKVSVKLVSEVGVGTIASGVAKAKADIVLISGHDGGTGASPLTAIKHAGLPWELGLSETQQSLVANHLRDRIRVQVDGQLKTGRDLAIAALMGAEEFGFGTTSLVALGCVMMRKCHLGTCPVGVATQNKELRNRFKGKPEHLINFMTFIARELREYMAELGFRTVDEMVGRVDRLETEHAVTHWKAKGLDFTAVLKPADATGEAPRRCTIGQEQDFSKTLDAEFLRLAKGALEEKKPVTIRLPVKNVNRTVGAMLGGRIAKKYGGRGLPENTIRIELTGSAGQSLGAFLPRGVTLRVEGDVNDYVGKGLSGGRIIVVPPRAATYPAHENVIAGNVALYGATRGELFVNGLMGERFAIRNSGADAVVEGVGDHGCEYMTGGTVVVLGPTGYNFAAGMSGGVAYILDENDLFELKCNHQTADIEGVWSEEDKAHLKGLIEKHREYTGSEKAGTILANWETMLPMFVKVMPIEYREVLKRMKLSEDRDRDTVSASEEVYGG